MRFPILGGRFGYFLFFSAWGGGRFLLKIPGGGSPGGRGAKGPGGCLGDWGGGGGATCFFSGPKWPPSIRNGQERAERC